jgi:hypothetical protein
MVVRVVAAGLLGMAALTVAAAGAGAGAVLLACALKRRRDQARAWPEEPAPPMAEEA